MRVCAFVRVRLCVCVFVYMCVSCSVRVLLGRGRGGGEGLSGFLSGATRRLNSIYSSSTKVKFAGGLKEKLNENKLPSQSPSLSDLFPTVLFQMRTVTVRNRGGSTFGSGT